MRWTLGQQATGATHRLDEPLAKFFQAVYWPVSGLAAKQVDRPIEILLLNPVVRDLMASDLRVTYRVLDVFAPRVG